MKKFEKQIIVRWEMKQLTYGVSDPRLELGMSVVESDHPNYSNNIHFDFGKLEQVCKEGYAVIILPVLL